MSLLDLLRTLPAPELAGAARALPDEDLAAIVRELPDFRLGQLVAGAAGVAQREVKPAKAKPTRALRKELAQRAQGKPAAKSGVAAARDASSEKRQVVEAREKVERVHAFLVSQGAPTACSAIAKALKLTIDNVSRYLRTLVAEGRVERMGGKSGPGVRYVAAGRQTSSRKASRPVRGADEEEGAGVKLSVSSPGPDTVRMPKHFVPQLKRAVRQQAAVVEALDAFEPDEEVTTVWKPTPVLKPKEENVVAILAPPVEPSAVRATTDRIRCAPYRATLTVETCLSRQKASGGGPRKVGTFVSGGGTLVDHYEKCRGCPIGAEVRGRVAS